MVRLLRRLRTTGMLIGLKRLCRPDSYLRRMGWFESFRSRLPVDPAGNPVPWYTYPTTAFLTGRIGPQMAIFEYGSGHSTLWWSRRVRQVVSCEHNPKWYERLRGRLPANVNYRLLEAGPVGPYVRAITEYQDHFDIIIVDGAERIACCRNCCGALKRDGVILWDNSDRDEYQPGYEYLAAQGFRRLDFTGMGPSGHMGWATTIFYRSENCLGI
jgi:hypothetical protein